MKIKYQSNINQMNQMKIKWVIGQKWPQMIQKILNNKRQN